MAITWDEHVAQWPAMQDAAIRQRICFCKCGCTNDGATPGKVLGIPVPGLCEPCRAATRTKRGARVHGRAIQAAERWAEPEMDDEPVSLRRRILRAISPDKRATATDYARRYGAEGSALMTAMHERVLAGKSLTDAQVEAVLRSKAAEERSVRATYRRHLAEEQRRGREADLARVRLDAVPDGRYAVEADAGDWTILVVERPTRGTLAGFTVVKGMVGEGLVRYGIQRAPAWRDADRFPRFYEGHLPHLVAKVASNPAKAAADYESLWGKPE